MVTTERPLHIIVAGDLDTLGGHVLLDLVKSTLMLPRRSLILDLNGVKHLDNRGTLALISAIQQVRDCGGSIRLARIDPAAHEDFSGFSLLTEEPDPLGTKPTEVETLYLRVSSPSAARVQTEQPAA